MANYSTIRVRHAEAIFHAPEAMWRAVSNTLSYATAVPHYLGSALVETGERKMVEHVMSEKKILEFLGERPEILEALAKSFSHA